ncbi:hypothetical protein, partial [Rhizobium sp. WYCCWR 11146]|uniref:hypothetical protein n=1 Tax=Rhizobium sp. WYCCWR 11146 TaxID=2749833 RepID=UPI0015E664A5
MNKLPLFVAVFFTIADAATSALAIDAVRDRPATLPEVRVQVIQRAAMDTIIMSPAERATLRCLEATNRVLAFSNGRVIHITIGLPDPDLLEMLNTATASIGRAVPSERAEAPPTPQHPSSGDDYEAVRRLLSPSGDWSAKTFNHLSTLKGQVARLVTVEEAIGELGAAAHALLLASEVQDARPWPDERSIIIYLERPEACKDASLGSFLENTVANVGAQVESLDILDSVAKILLSVDTTASQILPLSSLSYHEVCGSEDGVGMGGVACGRRFHRLLFPFYADREDEVVQGRTTGQSL